VTDFLARPAASTLARAALPCAAALLLAACGKKGPNQPPLRILPAPPREIAVRQIGPDVVVTALLSMQETDGRPLGPKAQVRILRLRPPDTLRPGAVSQHYLMRQFDKGAQAMASFSGAALDSAAPKGRLRFRDAGVLGRPPAAAKTRYMYSVLVIDEEGKRSPLPDPRVIEVAPSLPPPHDLKVETAEGEIRLAWQPGALEGAPGGPAPVAAAPRPSGPGGQASRPGGGAVDRVLFNLYRRTKAEQAMPDLPLNREPIDGTTFVDREFVYGETYLYLVRALERNETPLRESADSPEVEVHPVDIYPPKAPTGIAASAEGGIIRIYWFPNSEPDLAGYRVYRREAPGGEYTLLGQAGSSDTSLADTGARPGVRYYYVVTAIDTASPPNESVRSEVKSESRPSEAAPAPTARPEQQPSPAPRRRR